MTARNFLREHLAFWRRLEKTVETIPVVDHRFCGQYLIGTALMQRLREMVEEYARGGRIGDESIRAFCARWADRFLTIAFYDWQEGQSSFLKRHHATEALKATLEYTTDVQQLTFCGAGLIVGLDSDPADMSDLFGYLIDVYDFIEVGVRLELSAFGLRDI